MTKFHYMSDLHLEFAPLELPGGDNLLLAGDVCVAAYFAMEKYASKRQWFEDFFKIECAKYDRVVYIFGNHEYYRGSWQGARQKIQNALDDLGVTNVEILQDQATEIDDVLIFGTTMWTNFNNANPIDMRTAGYAMNDYRVIGYDSVATISENDEVLYEASRDLRPEDTLKSHQNSIKELADFLDMFADEKVVVMTHHAPSMQSIIGEYRDSGLNAAYASNLEDFILKYQPSHWLHGHIHGKNDYMIDKTRVLANPRGYVGERRCNHSFNTESFFEV